MALAVASRYARALVDAATARGAELEPRQVSEQLRDFADALRSATELHHILLSPAVPPARKRAVVGRIGKTLGLARLVQNFLYVVIDHRRIEILDQIRAAFETLLDERLGVVRADVFSAGRTGGRRAEGHRGATDQVERQAVRAEFAIDGALIGGVTARIGSTIYDGSVRGQLETLRRKMTAE